jgi:hypothetical protein
VVAGTWELIVVVTAAVLACSTSVTTVLGLVTVLTGTGAGSDDVGSPLPHARHEVATITEALAMTSPFGDHIDKRWHTNL